MDGSAKNRGFQSTAALVASLLFAALLPSVAANAALTPQQKCEGGKNDAAGKYAACSAKAERSYISTGDADRYFDALLKCEGKLVSTWAKLEAAAAAAGASCPSEADQAPVEGFLDACMQSVAAALGGGVLPLDVIACNTDLSVCEPDLATCADDLADCTSDCVAGVRPPLRTGQAACYDSAGAPIACAGTGQDGDVQKGAVRSFTDNDDGTVTDNVTGLMWEKLSDDASIHDMHNLNTWDEAFAVKVATLNVIGFAGHADWRVPNVAELLTLVDFNALTPAVASVFDNACAPGCTVITCSCTYSSSYWSSTTYQDPGAAAYAWVVDYYEGRTFLYYKPDAYSVRAVRGGS